MIVKAAPRLATILWLWKALVDGRSSTRGEHVPLVGELHQSQSQMQFIEAVHHIRWQCQWAKQSRPWWSVLGVLDVEDGETSGRRKVIGARSGAAFGNDGELSRCNSKYSKGKSKRASCVLWSPFLVLRKPRPRSPCTPAEPFCGEAAEASDKPTFAASKPEKMLEVATETLTR
jgi:hypothetical protein